MKKLVKGIVEFRKKGLPTYLEKFAHLAGGQSPDTLFIACSDSRVVPNLFASTDPGDLFVVRNVGNLIPESGGDGHSSADESEAAAIEFSIANLGVSHVIICGHSECGAMQALLDGREKVGPSNLRAWLRHGEDSLKGFQNQGIEGQKGLSPLNCLSQFNVLQQMKQLSSYPMVAERVRSGKIRLHAWWFDIRTASVYAFEETENRFVLIDEKESQRILARLD